MSIEVRDVCALLQVYDMPTAIRFYRDALGFEVTHKSQEGERFDWALLRLGDAEIMLNTQYEEDSRPDKRNPMHAVAHGDTCLYFGCPDVDGASRHLRAHGIDVDGPTVAPYGMKQLYLKDPDG